MRTNKVCCICGGRGTGKTTFLKGETEKNLPGIIPVYLQRNPDQKILIVDTFDSPVWKDVPVMDINKLKYWKRGVYRVYSSDTVGMMEQIEKQCFNAVLMFEDATKFIGSKLSEEVKYFVLDSKQKNLDIFFIFHSLMSIPNDLIRFSDLLTLFKTKERFTSYLATKYPIPGLEDLFRRVNDNESRFYHETVELTA